MQTGVITSENLSHVLRQLSQRRRQGILEIKLGERVLQVVFMSGRVIEAIDSDKTPVDEVIELLKRGGYIPEAFEAEIPASGDPYQQLFLELQDKDEFFVDEKLFARAIRCRVLEKLYQLDVANGAYYSFKIQMVDYDRELLPSVSVGQLLLDLVALEDDRERYSDTFPEDCWIESLPESSGVLSEEEEAIYELCKEPTPLRKVRDRVILSSFHLQDALLSLGDRDLIVVHPDGTQVSKTAENPKSESGLAGGSASVEDMMAALDQSIDDSFAGADQEVIFESSTAQEPDPLVEQGAETNQGSSRPRLVDEEEELDDEEWAEPSLKVRLNYMNMKMLHSSSIPHIIVVLFLMCATLIPVLRWGEILAAFGGF